MDSTALFNKQAFVRSNRFERVFVFCAAVCLLMILPMKTIQADAKLTFEQYKLANGLTVILQEDRSTPVVAVVMMNHVGSKNEKKGRTGFAHLFEHMMFQGSQHVGDNEHFKLLQEIGANINGTTNNDRTNYFESLPSHYLELALYLESDRLGYLLPAMTQEKLANQIDVVKNERRQRVDNVPYGTAFERIAKALYPDEHPYSWPVIGYMEDLSAASLDDVKEFFKIYYAPNNTCLVISGDIDKGKTKEWVDKYFGSFPTGTFIERPTAQPIELAGEKRMTVEDRVQLPRLYFAWPGAPLNTREDAVLDVLTDILAAGKNSRFYKSLVYEKQIAQSVNSFHFAMEIAGQLMIEATAKPGKTLTEIESAINFEIEHLINNGVSEREIQTSVNNQEARIINGRATALGRANSLATYHILTGDANDINRELERFKNITSAEVVAAARKFLTPNKVVLSFVPEGKSELAAERQTIEQKGGVEK